MAGPRILLQDLIDMFQLSQKLLDQELSDEHLTRHPRLLLTMKFWALAWDLLNKMIPIESNRADHAREVCELLAQSKFL